MELLRLEEKSLGVIKLGKWDGKKTKSLSQSEAMSNPPIVSRTAALSLARGSL